jgi:hypothetical protein
MRHIVFPYDEMGSMILWEVSLYARFNEQPYDDLGSMILWEVSLSMFTSMNNHILRIRKSMDRINEEPL